MVFEAGSESKLGETRAVTIMSRCEDDITTFPSFSVRRKIVVQANQEVFLPLKVRPVMARKARLGRKSRGAEQIAVNCHGGLRSLKELI